MTVNSRQLILQTSAMLTRDCDQILLIAQATLAVPIQRLLVAICISIRQNMRTNHSDELIH